ncbi:unnamed protein product [Rhizophagus irregularis]|uniref:Uncharacterized protein n=1 Tax=Rhizophagus irregularis TaxID=588596 RepID=A0A2I1HR30_9GLOM|nr:hypothetical protein RhiirA4_486202 [Rhizophagus irregularis]CAB4426910.1 unnamed protein product [Rhizophagus irregularis]
MSTSKSAGKQRDDKPPSNKGTSKSAGKQRDDKPPSNKGTSKSAKKEEKAFSKYVKEQQKIQKEASKNKKDNVSPSSSGARAQWPIERLKDGGRSIEPIKPKGRVEHGKPPSLERRPEPANMRFVADQVRDNPYNSPPAKSGRLKVDSATFGVGIGLAGPSGSASITVKRKGNGK